MSKLDQVPGNSWLEKEISRKTPHTDWCRSKKDPIPVWSSCVPAGYRTRNLTGLNSTNNQYWNCNMYFHYTRMQCRSEVVLFSAKCVCLKPHFSDLTKLNCHTITNTCISDSLSEGVYRMWWLLSQIPAACFVVTYIADKSRTGMSKSPIKIIVRRFKRYTTSY